VGLHCALCTVTVTDTTLQYSIQYTENSIQCTVYSTASSCARGTHLPRLCGSRAAAAQQHAAHHRPRSAAGTVGGREWLCPFAITVTLTVTATVHWALALALALSL